MPRLIFIFLLLVAPARAIEKRGEEFILRGKNWTLVLDARGSIVSSRGASAKSTLWNSDAPGLWSARLGDNLGNNTLVRALDAREVESELSADATTLTLKYLHPALEVLVTATEGPDSIDWRAQATPKAEPLIEFALPARLRFDAPSARRLVTSAHTHDAPGLAWKPAFFARQSIANPASWSRQSIGPSAYGAVLGGPPIQRDLAEPAVALTLTPTGREWLGEDAVQIIAERTTRVTRPMTPEQADVTLIDSANGPFLSGSKLKGSGGMLWRVGAIVPADNNDWAAQIIAQLISKIARDKAASASPGASPSTSDASPGTSSVPVKIALLALKRGPTRGDYAGVSIEQWRARLGAIAGVQVEEIAGLFELERALASREHTAILNPYGEAIPTRENETPLDMALRVASWVKSGGHWIETGGFSFFQALRPALFASYSAPYPGSFAHFFHLDGNGASSALFCVQPQRETGWQAIENPALALVPSRWSVGSDESGAFLEAAWTPWIASGATWISPISRMSFGGSALENARRHTRDNLITRTLNDKMPPALLQKWKSSVLLYLAGDAQSKTAALKYLPSGTTLHFADYLRGGFDKQYPDHLPPNPQFGTSEQMSEFFLAARRAGHIVMPYTNPTWWSDDPPGPTFVREGRAPLLLNADGTNTREAYDEAIGWTITPWHASVRAANAQIRAQFTQEFPVDVLFQDQIGAREPRLDFNPVSPLPHAYNAGLLALAQENSAVVPLSTENGWDHLVNWESQMCGFSFSTVPTEGAPEWRTFLRDRMPPDSFEVFPLAQAMAHDKLTFAHHDLGQFVTNREVLAWTLALGFTISARADASALDSDGPREWLKYLDRIQKTIGAPMMGAPINSWEYLDRDTISAKYGGMSITSGLKPNASTWRAQSPQVLGVDDGRRAPIISSRRADGRFDVWLYAAPESRAALWLPLLPSASRATIRFDGQQKGAPLILASKIPPEIRVPARQGRVLPPKELNQPPQNWKAKPKIGIIEMPGVATPWSQISPAQWKSTLQKSDLATQFGLEIEVLSTPSQVLLALEGGPTQYFAIVNPHTEIFPTSGRGQWREMLAAIKKYVENGGHWWATGGYSFFVAAWPDGENKWQTEPIGPMGMRFFGAEVGSGEAEAAPQNLKVAREGTSWLSEELKEKIASSSSVINRALPIGAGDPGHIALVEGEGGTWIGGYRLNGWGALWRIGGFSPKAEIALPAVLESLKYLWTHAPPPVRVETKYLWHAIVEPVKPIGSTTKARR